MSPGDQIFVSIMCIDPPFFLAAGTPIAQAFLLPNHCPEQVPSNPTIMWVQIVGTNKPIMGCSLFYKGEKIHCFRMLDTRADVTIIACSKWPANWELESVVGMISGIGGGAVSMRSKRNVIIGSPKGKMATIRPFVVTAPLQSGRGARDDVATDAQILLQHHTWKYTRTR